MHLLPPRSYEEQEDKVQLASKLRSNKYTMGSSRYFKSQTFIFYLHYLLISSGVCGCSILLGVYLKEYSDASQGEIGMLLMTFPLVSIIVKPLFCSMADRRAAHKQFLLSGLAVMHLSYVPFIVLPFFPSFYLNHLRLSWWLLAFFSEIGSAALGLVWCLGDCLTVNAAAKSGTATFGQIRLVGTVSWGVVSSRVTIELHNFTVNYLTNELSNLHSTASSSVRSMKLRACPSTFQCSLYYSLVP